MSNVHVFVSRVCRFAPEAVRILRRRLARSLRTARSRLRLAWERSDTNWPENLLAEVLVVGEETGRLRREELARLRAEWDRRGRRVEYEGPLTTLGSGRVQLIEESALVPDVEEWIVEQLGMDTLEGETRRVRLTIEELEPSTDVDGS